MKLGCNSVLFGGYDLETAFKYVALCGYDGIELSAIEGMSDHLVLDCWQELVPQIQRLSKEFDLGIFAIEQPSHDAAKMEAAFQVAADIGIPIVNCGPGGKTGDNTTFAMTVDVLGKLSESASRYGVTLCVKAHVGQCVHDTPTSLKLLQAIKSPSFGLDMDPSHIHRANEDVISALRAVVHRIHHVHIRDCQGRNQSPGLPAAQANGRGDIDLLGYIRVLHESGFQGPIDLEIIGAKALELPHCVAIAAESRGHMQACLQACGAKHSLGHS